MLSRAGHSWDLGSGVNAKQFSVELSRVVSRQATHRSPYTPVEVGSRPGTSGLRVILGV